MNRIFGGESDPIDLPSPAYENGGNRGQYIAKSILYLCRYAKRQAVLVPWSSVLGTLSISRRICHPERTQSVSRNFRSRGVAERRKSRGACTPKGYETSLMYPFRSKELSYSYRQNKHSCIERHSHTLKKCEAFFAFRSGLHHSRKFDAAGVLLCVPLKSTVRPALLRVTNGHDGYDPREVSPAGQDVPLLFFFVFYTNPPLFFYLPY